MVHHSVIINLKHVKNSVKEKYFFEAAKKLGLLPRVRNFKILKQTNSKNIFEYDLSMEFANQMHYDRYTIDPRHLKFIEENWSKHVVDFLEIDYEIYHH